MEDVVTQTGLPISIGQPFTMGKEPPPQQEISASASKRNSAPCDVISNTGIVGGFPQRILAN
jgi:hypothetical protein